MAAQNSHRVWTAVITVGGYNPMVATWSERDLHDDQFMQAAHDALGAMRATGDEVGIIDLFRDSDESGNQWVEHRTVTRDQRGIVVSPNLNEVTAVEDGIKTGVGKIRGRGADAPAQDGNAAEKSA